jgi:drug/metabolite transporter (DMT)-like permease
MNLPWYVYAFGAVILGTFFAIFRKKALQKVHSMQFESARTLAAIILSLLFVPFVDFDISFKAIVLMYVISLLAVIGLYFMAKSYKHMELSVLMPLTNLKLVFVALLGYFLLSETVNLKNILGIAIILAGAYIIEANHNTSDIKRPLKLLFQSKYSLFLLFAIVIFSVTALLDKILVTDYVTPATAMFFVWIFIGINMNVAHGIKYGFKELKTVFKETKSLPFVVAFFSLTADFLSYQALSMTYVSLVTPVLMLSSLLVVIVGGRFFHEENLIYRTIVSVVMLLGVYLIIT